MSKPRKPKGRPISGWLILDKPVDFGSTEAVSKIKWLFKAQRRVAATLDVVGQAPVVAVQIRSEERRVGKECRSRWSPYH